MDTHYFVRLPEELYDALREDKINFHMFTVMAVLHRWANWHTGVVRTCSAERLQAALGGEHNPDDVPSIRTIQRALQGCHEAGWVTSGYRKGSKKPYSVTISNFIPAKGLNSGGDVDADRDGEPQRINVKKTKDWKLTKAFRGIREDADRGADVDAERTLSGREEGGLNETSYETSEETLHETPGNEEVSELVNNVAARRGAPQPTGQEWDELTEEERGFIRAIASGLEEKLGDSSYSVFKVYEIVMQVKDALLEAGARNSDDAKAISAGVTFLADIYTGPRWKKAHKTLDALHMWLGNPPNSGKSLREQLVTAVRDRLATHRDRKSLQQAKPEPREANGLTTLAAESQEALGEAAEERLRTTGCSDGHRTEDCIDIAEKACLEGEVEMDEGEEPSHAEQEPARNAGQTSAMEEFKKSLSELFD